MQIKTSPDYRICRYPRCTNILSIYNHEALCNIHLNPSFWKDKVDGMPVVELEPALPAKSRKSAK